MKKPAKKATKVAASYRLSGEALALIAKLAKHHGISQAAVIEMAVREQARKDRVSINDDKVTTSRKLAQSSVSR